MDYHELGNSVVLSVLALLFYFQNKRLSSMKSFVDIFDVNKVKEYVKMNEETVMGKAANLVSDDKKVRDIMLEVTSEKIDELSVHYAEIMGKRLVQSCFVNYQFIKSGLSEEKWEPFIDEHLPESKEFIMKLLYPDSSDKSNL